jgi:hypothetical protein
MIGYESYQGDAGKAVTLPYIPQYKKYDSLLYMI